MRIRVLTFLMLSVSLACPHAQTTTEPNPNPLARQPVRIEPLLREATDLLKSEHFQEALRLAKRARTLSQRRGYKGREAHATNLMALATLSLGRVTEAIALFKQVSVTSGETTSDEVRKIQVTALDRAGRLSRTMGRYEDALWCLNQALQLHRQRPGQIGEALILSHLSAVYADTGDFMKASQALQEALPVSRTRGDRFLEKSLLLRAMIVEKGRGNLTAALQFGEQAQAILLRRTEASSHSGNNKQPAILTMELQYNLGLVYAALQQHPKAIERFQLALQRAREVYVPQVQAFALGDLAWSQFKLGEAKTALETITQALTTLRQGGGNKHVESKFLFTRAEVQRALGRNAEALTSYRQAIATLEQARSLSIPTEISRAGIVASRHNVFAGAIDFLISQQQTAEALEVAEAYHARAFLDVLTGAGIESSQELTAAQHEEEDKLFAQIASVQKELWDAELKPEQEPQLQRKLTEVENALETFRLKVRRANPRYASLESPPLIKPANIAKDLLDKDTALVEFVLSEKKSFAWIIHRDKLVSVALPPGKEIEDLVNEYRNEFSGKVNSLTALQAIAKQKAQGQKLYQKLFQPLDAHLTTARKLVIVPDGALAYLPFETLLRDTAASYLLERFAISYAPSASALAAIRSNRPGKSGEAKGLIAFGDPVYAKMDDANADEIARRSGDLKQLPYTRTEVNEIAALFPAAERRVLLGTDAQEQIVKTAPLHQYRYVHFAAHSNVDEDNPARSGIILTMHINAKDDGMLQVSEVMRLKLNADLVTLSACRTGLGKLLHGEGIIGLTRAFFYAGADSVTVSLWNVNDIATASLMKSFYKNLQQGKGKAKDEALRQAKLELLKGPQRAWRHPYYWAAFVLVGEQ